MKVLLWKCVSSTLNMQIKRKSQWNSQRYAEAKMKDPTWVFYLPTEKDWKRNASHLLESEKNKSMLVFIPNADLSTIATNRMRKVDGNSQTVFCWISEARLSTKRVSNSMHGTHLGRPPSHSLLTVARLHFRTFNVSNLRQRSCYSISKQFHSTICRWHQMLPSRNE